MIKYSYFNRQKDQTYFIETIQEFISRIAETQNVFQFEHSMWLQDNNGELCGAILVLKTIDEVTSDPIEKTNKRDKNAKK